MLKRGHQVVIAQLCSLYVQTYKTSISPYLQKVIYKHSKVFEDITKGLPPPRDQDHAIHLILGSILPNMRRYRCPYGYKSEIEHTIEEMLEDGMIRPNQSSYCTPVVMVHNKEGSWCMCPYYRELN